MDDQSRILMTIQHSIFAKMSHRAGQQSSPVDNLQLLTNFLKLLYGKVYQSKIDSCIPFVLAVHDTKYTDGIQLDEGYLESVIDAGDLYIGNVIEVGYDLKLSENIIFENIFINDYEELNDLGRDKTSIKFFLVQGNALHFYYDGYIKYIPNIWNEKDYRGYDSRGTITEIESVLERYRNQFHKSSMPFYWKSKAKRILRSAPENMLAQDLYLYLDRSLSDGIVDAECLNNHTADRLDIRVVHQLTRKVYIFEVKWIGVSSGNKYIGTAAHKRAHEGINQLHFYLDDDVNCVKGILVLYDARNKDEDIVWEESEKWNKRIFKPPFRLFLESTSASTKAKYKKK
tara:strand:+ start:927 stop:1955 length:1029 start_codon:yes stop_codon:yes gene_type:complete